MQILYHILNILNFLSHVGIVRLILFMIRFRLGIDKLLDTQLLLVEVSHLLVNDVVRYFLERCFLVLGHAFHFPDDLYVSEVFVHPFRLPLI